MEIQIGWLIEHGRFKMFVGTRRWTIGAIKERILHEGLRLGNEKDLQDVANRLVDLGENQTIHLEVVHDDIGPSLIKITRLRIR